MKVPRVALLLRADPIGQLLVFRLGCGGVDRRGPLEVTFAGIAPFLKPLDDALIGPLHFDAELPFLFRNGRDKPGEMLIHRLPSERKVLLELIRRHEKRRAHRIEGARAAVGRQFPGIDLDTEEVADRFLVFAAVEAPHRDFSTRVGELVARGHEGAGEGFEKGGLGLVGGLRLVLGRHLAGVHGIEDLLPEIGSGNVVEDERNVVEPDLALLFVGVVAGGAMFAEKDPVRFIEHSPGRRGVGEDGEEEE